ncbi:Protein CBG27981 [Caenorhabditis briggsae]|uniref:Protein CBG27981 n=1 Tax=Caenorhabditis briggsae TaxID=6238 RepID=B6IJS3_CAEBR|nr:Protein CBG27981 [Caenorhabditis briggsae]CAS00153.1 Protein CBG27981 [Caenorhabditis briggsae]
MSRFPLPVISLHHVNRRSIGTFAPHNRRVQPFILAAVFGMISTIISLYKKKALFKVPVYSLIQVGLNSTMLTYPINSDLIHSKPECPS